MILFDVCWTMYRSNTTFDFIKFACRKKGKNKLKILLLNFIFIKIFLLILGKFISKDIYRYIYISCLKGYTKDELTMISKDFYNDFLIKNKIEFTFDILGKEKTSDIFLCSASLDVVVKNIAYQLGVGFFASELDYINRICTGKLKIDLLGNKDIILKRNDVDLVVTDNLSDLNIVKKSKRHIILSTQKNISFWKQKGIDVDFIL